MTAEHDTTRPDLPAVRKAAEEAIRRSAGVTAYFPVTALFLLSLLDRIEELEREVTVWRSGGVYVSKADWDEEDLIGGLLSAEGRQRFAEMTEKPPQPGAAQRRIDKLEDELRERRRK